MRQTLQTDIVIIGGGIVGLTIARELAERRPTLSITVLEKEPALALHASGRNSGVLHAGFYYTPDSLKARFTAEGNRLLTDYCLRHGLRINRCGKVVVAKDDGEIDALHELKRRGDSNGVDLRLIGEKDLDILEPNARTHGLALHSPATSTVDPREVVGHIAAGLAGRADILLNEKFIGRDGDRIIRTRTRRIQFNYLFNAAGLYADRVAREFGAGMRYTLLPFKGLYMAYRDPSVVTRHVYPVPDIDNPFLGVHFTKTADGGVMVGPTAIPAFWRENYAGLSRFRPRELLEVLYYESALYRRDSFHFRRLVREEVRKYSRRYLARQASLLVKEIRPDRFGPYLEPGIRAQLVDTTAMTLVMDFVVEHGEHSTHVLNAVSPAFTGSFSFSRYLVDEFERRADFLT